MIRLMVMSQLKQANNGEASGIFAGPAGDQLKETLDRLGVSMFQAFRYERLIFAYMEVPNGLHDFQWPEAFQPYLEQWPGEEAPRYCVPLIDIYHDGRPDNEEEWRAGHKPTERCGSLAKLKPDMFASYVFYHYQFQEEAPGSFNKYYTIGSHEKYIFSYSELPSVIDRNPRKGLLDTKHTPGNWGEVMYPHFELWSDLEDDHNIWRSLEHVFQYEKAQ